MTVAAACLATTPAGLASNGTVVAVTDLAGWLFRLHWPAGPVSVLRAHGDAASVVAVGEAFATSGSWDPTVCLWDSGELAPRFSVSPFDGRVTALATLAGDLLVAGADRRPAAGARSDRVNLAGGQVVRLTTEGRVTDVLLRAECQITALVSGADWFVAAEDGDEGRLCWWQAGRGGVVSVQGGRVTALATDGDGALAANGWGIWRLAAPWTTAVREVEFDFLHPIAFQLVVVGATVAGATSEGVILWRPYSRRITRDAAQPVAIAQHGESLLVLWPGGHLVEYEPGSRSTICEVTVPVAE